MNASVVSPRALTGVRVLDLTQHHGYASKLFSDLGAEVTLVEPPGGIKARRHAPFAAGRTDAEASLHFQYLSAGKKSVIVDFGVESDCALFRELLRASDIVIDDNFQDEWEARGLNYEKVAALNPRLVWCAITAFGQDGPRIVADDAVAMASGGMAWLTGYADTGPLIVDGELSIYSSAQYAAVMSMIAYLGVDTVGSGQFIDVSMQAVVALGTETAPQFLQLKGVERRRLGESERQAGIGLYPCRDGHVLLYAANSGLGTGWSDIVDWLRECNVPDADVLAGAEWKDNTFKAREENKRRFREIFSAFSLRRGKQELFEEGQARHIAIAPINTSAEAFHDPHLSACGFFRRVGKIADAPLVGPGAPYRLSATPWMAGERAPQAGEHSEVIRRALMTERVLA